MRRWAIGVWAAILCVGALWGGALGAGALGGSALASAPSLARTDNVEVELVADHAAIAPGETVYVALRQNIKPKWHTYWRNPGDSGEPTEIAWTMPAGFAAGDIVWPIPKRIAVGPLVNYGFEGEILLPVPVTAPDDLKVGAPVTLTAAARWLVCEEICIPEEATLSLTLATAAASLPNPVWRARIEAARKATAQPVAWTSAVSRDDQGARLSLGAPDLAQRLRDGAVREAYFFPLDPAMVDHAAPQQVAYGPSGVSIGLKPAPNSPIGAKPLEGWLVAADSAGAKTAYAIAAPPGAALAGTQGALLRPAPAESEAGLGLIAALGFAFLGGLILNLMPCVFPILSIKALSVAQLAHSERGKAVMEAWAFAAGVLATFLALAGALIALKAAGVATGWGFQLQSPILIAGLAVLFVAIALSLLGAFEVGGSLQNVGGGLADRGGALGAFFTGALGVIVASPCTAPFMGAALGWAFTQPAPATLGVFAALGVGFAAPFVGVVLAPGLLQRLPKPGPWMVRFKEFLAFPMFATAAWLAWVFAHQTGPDGLVRLLAAMVGVGFFVWVWRAARHLGWRVLAGALAAALIGWTLTAPVAPVGAVAPADAAAMQSEPWSPARVAQLQAEGRVVFVNFTAAWCVTCKMNERVALSGAGLKAAMDKANAVYLVADWTNRDEAIAAELAAHGRSGVPLYLVYPGRVGAEPRVLPQLLTERAVAAAIADAAR